MPELATIGIFAGVSLLTAACAVWGTGALAERRRNVPRDPVFADMTRRYEFREGYLISPIDPNDAFLPAETDRSAAFETLDRALRQLDPDLSGRLANLARRGDPFIVTTRFGQDTLGIAGRPEDDRLVITIGPTETREGRLAVDAAAFDALRAELEELRAAVDAVRAPVWRQDEDGQVLWANAPYHALVEQLSATDPGAPRWPSPALFDDALAPAPEPGATRRVRLPLPKGHAPDPHAGDGLWYEVGAEPRKDGGLLATAVPVSRLVAAETSLRNFVQTLSKTFAQLPIGLAVFDKRRELMLFNPALVTLSTLEPLFLSQRPTLVAFLDALRDRRRMPEPKNYRSWRDEIARLEQDAEAGTYQELWSLPDGTSFRVIGRPHPDGAVAFMFEDITSEVSLTRQFRGELDLFRAVVDDWPGALAVFSSEGRLVLANAAYAALWSEEAGAQIGVQSLAAATRRWQSACAPSGLWGDIRAFADRKAERAAWCEEVVQNDGQRLSVRVAPLSGGAISVRFDRIGRPRMQQPDRPARLHEVAEPPAAFQSRRGGER